MLASIYLLSCALTVGQANDRAEWQLTPQLTPGLELVYRGSFVDESLIPNVQHHRQYHLETNVLVLDAKAKGWRAAILTALSIQDGGQLTAKKNEGPTSVRLELVDVDIQGRVRIGEKVLEVPLAGPPTLEGHFLVPAPLVKVGRHFLWQVGEEGRPVQSWQIVGTEPCGGVSCVKITGVQQSEDWDKPRADQTAWRRRDTIWLLPQLNFAQKVERIIERREPARQGPTQRTTARYELDTRLKYPDGMFADRKQEILLAKKFHDDALPLVKKPAQSRLEISGLLQRLTTHLERTKSLHYRKAFTHVKDMLESARQTGPAVPQAIEESLPPTLEALTIGQRAPDFAVSCLTADETARLQSHRGKPVLVVFYNPATPMGREVIDYVKQLNEKHRASVAIMAMAVTQDAELVRKQHREMRLAFPILDGNGMRLSFGAVQTPRVVLLDGEGMVRMTQTGWGYQTPGEIHEEVQRCLVPQEKKQLPIIPK